MLKTAYRYTILLVMLGLCAGARADQVEYKDGSHLKDGIPKPLRQACEAAEAWAPPSKTQTPIVTLRIFSEKSGARGGYCFSKLELGDKTDYSNIYYDADGRVFARINSDEGDKKAEKDVESFLKKYSVVTVLKCPAFKEVIVKKGAGQ